MCNFRGRFECRLGFGCGRRLFLLSCIPMQLPPIFFLTRILAQLRKLSLDGLRFALLALNRMFGFDLVLFNLVARIMQEVFLSHASCTSLSLHLLVVEAP